MAGRRPAISWGKGLSTSQEKTKVYGDPIVFELNEERRRLQTQLAAVKKRNDLLEAAFFEMVKNEERSDLKGMIRSIRNAKSILSAATPPQRRNLFNGPIHNV